MSWRPEITGRVLVTYNLRDFIPLSQQWAEATQEHPGLVLIHSRTVAIEDLGGLVRRLAVLLDAYPQDDALRDRVLFLE